MTSQSQRQTFNRVLAHCTEVAFGEMGFMLTVPEEELSNSPQVLPWKYGCYVNYTGPFNGQLFVLTSANIIEPLTMNMIGIMPPEKLPDGIEMTDSLKEMTNVICGNMLPLMGGDKAVFNIGAPELQNTPLVPESIDGLVCQAKITLPVEEGFVSVAFFVSEDADLPDDVTIE